MKYWMIKDGNSEGPFSLEELTAHGLAAETKVWRQGLPQWTEARLVPEFAQILGVKVVEKHRAADDAVRHCPTHLRAAVVTTVIIALSFFNVFAPLSLLGSPFFYLLLPLSWLKYFGRSFKLFVWSEHSYPRAIGLRYLTITLRT